jgi:hypothetical protein
MKIPLLYPKIPENKSVILGKCIAFEKYDGTNMHWLWTPGIGWTHFGTRRTRFTFDDNGLAEFKQTHPELEEAPYIFSRAFVGIVNDAKHEIILFTEFLGEKSFAGTHQAGDKKRLVLFDAMVNGKLLAPKQFLDSFVTFNPPEEYEDEFDTPAIIYSGKYTGQLAEDVRKGKYPVNEGVVVKGIVDGEIFMTKIKTNDYLRRLRKR